MAGYGYAPPPPPPSAAGAQQQSYSHQPAPAYASQQQHGRGGGPSGRGRGGHYSNGHHNPAPPGPYEYAGQPYPGHQAAPYGGQQPPPATYQPGQPQWRPDHAQQAAHAPAPLSVANYHPNYAHQPYQAPQPQYPQQSAYGAPQQPYPQPYQSQPPPPQQWGGQGAPYGNGRSQRGGYNDRGGFDNRQPPPMNNYGQTYPPNPQASHAPHFQYAPPPPPPASGFQGNNYTHGGGRRNDRGGKFGKRGGNQSGQRSQKNNHQNHHNNDRNGGGRVKPENSNGPDNSNAGKKKKRKTNTLGLTPGMESDSEDDENEEKSLPKLLGSDQYEVTDLEKFLKERRANFPTKARAEEKKVKAAAQEEENEELQLEKKRDKLRKQLAMVESSIKRKRELGDEGDEMRDLSLNDSEEDEKPEVMTSQKPTAPAPPPPARKADVKRHCKYFSTGGLCGKKSKCRFVHDIATREAAMKEREQNDGNLTISQRLILNDKEQEDLAILESIQYLRERGIMKKEASSNQTKDVKGDSVKSESNESPKITAPVATPPIHNRTSLLPPASASLPPPPPKREVGPRRDHGQSKQKPLPASLPTPISAGSQPPSSAWLQEEFKPSGKQGQENLP